MADCFAMEMDDLHRRWLPPEIFADIGIADAAAPPAAAIEGLTAHLAGLIGDGGGVAAPRSTLPPVAPASYNNQIHRAPVCGLEGQVLVAHGGTVVCPFSPVQWPVTQVATGLVNGGGGGLHPASRLCSPPPKRRGGGGTGVFLPRAEVYQTASAAAKSTTGRATFMPLTVGRSSMHPPAQIFPTFRAA
ncbi:hypothetical protein GUJ93_ZPchr0012g20074 [Zizania palustris]|uniref:Uncharacterized protein n=1 Tax=Zizania palustris TaxID=103762 RepID=A0A8J5WV15_ZIZPA|nr:hypothetical protein GUJ93_ZPchr0012g20074 [Zizania palustris]